MVICRHRRKLRGGKSTSPSVKQKVPYLHFTFAEEIGAIFFASSAWIRRFQQENRRLCSTKIPSLIPTDDPVAIYITYSRPQGNTLPSSSHSQALKLSDRFNTPTKVNMTTTPSNPPLSRPNTIKTPSLILTLLFSPANRAISTFFPSLAQ
jgi:hypothetical protein